MPPAAPSGNGNEVRNRGQGTISEFWTKAGVRLGCSQPWRGPSLISNFIMDEQKFVCHLPKGLSHQRRRGVPLSSLHSRCARGEGVIASNAGYGPIPRPLWCSRYGHRGRGLAAVCGRLAWAPRDGACARQEAWGRLSSSLGHPWAHGSHHHHGSRVGAGDCPGGIASPSRGKDRRPT